MQLFAILLVLVGGFTSVAGSQSLGWLVRVGLLVGFVGLIVGLGERGP